MAESWQMVSVRVGVKVELRRGEKRCKKSQLIAEGEFDIGRLMNII
jgi:hypothetical protein